MDLMKNIFILPVSLLILLTFTSCEDFLDVEPTSQSIAVENTSADSILFKTASDVEGALAGA